MTILVDTFFAANPDGHGGNHRTAQLAELIAQANFTTTLLDRTLLTTSQSRYFAGLQAVLNPSTHRFIAKHKLKLARSPVALAFCGFQRHLYQSALRQHTGSKLLLWEATKNYIAPYVAADSGFKVIALPHNLEALVPGQGAFFEGFETEVRALVKADTVFCISREEEWLLRIKGANAYFLPYYPPEAILRRLLQVREARATSTKRGFLILGNANNPPTRNGMIEQLERLRQVEKTLDFYVDIVGYGTERLAEYCDGKTYTIHGAVTNEKLDEFLIGTQAALVHQKPTSGALTRIPELLISGVPVIANTNACRSVSDYAGVYHYESWIELADWMSQSLPMPKTLDHPVAAEKRFMECIRQFS